ncbi:hypothetical protein XFF1815_670142 [Xanthomonas citri pv. fuscans]|nr:hypothetical protein XFF1815_670142 [Xanthomonas citri pv. fuscans]
MEAAMAPSAKLGGAHWGTTGPASALIRPSGTFSRKREKVASRFAQPLPSGRTRTRNPHPASRIPHPESRIPHPASRIPHPESRIPNPESRIPNPESRIPNPESRPLSHTVPSGTFATFSPPTTDASQLPLGHPGPALHGRQQHEQALDREHRRTGVAVGIGVGRGGRLQQDL